MLQFALAFQETGKFKDTVLNRGRNETRRLHQARTEQIAIQNMEDETAATTALFNSFNFYADFLIAILKERFAPITLEPIAYFSIFDYNNCPQPVGSASFNSYGDTEVRNLLKHFSLMYSVKEKTQAMVVVQNVWCC